MWVIWLALGFGQGRPHIDEEVVVYDQAFAQWDGTRWLVEGEVLMPVPLLLGVDRRHTVRTSGTQVRMVLACDIDQAGRHRAEVLCGVEDIGWTALAVSGAPGPRELARVTASLEALDQATSAATLQLQVRSDGRVTNVDLEGLEARTSNDRLLQESVRQVLAQAVAGFHLHRQGTQEQIVHERNPRLMQMPFPTASRGSSRFAHHVERQPDGLDLWTTTGSGTVATRLPDPGADATNARTYRSKKADELEVFLTQEVKKFKRGSGGGPGNGAGAADDKPVSRDDAKEQKLEQPGMEWVQDLERAPDVVEANPNDAARVLGPEVIYALEARALAVHDPASGLLVERAWWITGTPTASSAGGILNTPYRNVGRFLQLAPDESVDVGPTRLVTWRGEEGGETWQDLDPLPE